MRGRLLFSLSFGTLMFAILGMARAEDFFLAAGGDMPGKLWLSEGGTAERIRHARAGRPDPAFPNAIMKVGQIAVTADHKIFFCSGLDGSLMHLLDGRHEIQVFEFDGQIRDLACTGEAEVIYFSVVPTPQNGEPLADGKIYRRHFGEGRPTVVATIRQADVGGNWWGAFTIKDGAIHIATLENDSRIFKVAGDSVTEVGRSNGHKIRGLTVGGDGAFYFVDGNGKVFKTTNFQTAESVLATGRRLTDVNLAAPADGARP